MRCDLSPNFCTEDDWHKMLTAIVDNIDQDNTNLHNKNMIQNWSHIVSGRSQEHTLLHCILADMF